MKNPINLLTGIIATILLVILIGVYRLPEKDVEIPTETISYKIDDVDELSEVFIAGSLSATQMQRYLNDYLDMTPDFNNVEDVSIESDETSKAVVQTLDMKNLLTAYLDGLYVQRNKLNRIVAHLTPELQLLSEASGTSLRESYVTVEHLYSPSVEGLMKELYNTPLFLHEEDGEYSVWVDYELVQNVYNKHLNRFHIDLIRLHRDVSRFGYTRADGEIDARIIYNRLLLIDDVQDGNTSKDDFFWEHERYQLATLFTGYGTEELPKWDSSRIKQMEGIVKEETTPNTYTKFITDLLETIVDNNYSKESLKVANDWMFHEFLEYSEHLEEQEVVDK